MSQVRIEPLGGFYQGCGSSSSLIGAYRIVALGAARSVRLAMRDVQELPKDRQK